MCPLALGSEPSTDPTGEGKMKNQAWRLIPEQTSRLPPGLQARTAKIMQPHVPGRGRPWACIFWAFAQPMGTICVERPGATGPGTTLFWKTSSPVIASEELNTQNGMHPDTSNPLPSHCPARDGSCRTLPSPQPLPEAATQPLRCFGPGCTSRMNGILQRTSYQRSGGWFGHPRQL